ncbi:MAG: hypothetical protein H0W09_08420, partial [Solirubrobacterales bacterium]|nr:hypothetical protein [Solirubrobacterales bacterium]
CGAEQAPGDEVRAGGAAGSEVLSRNEPSSSEQAAKANPERLGPRRSQAAEAALPLPPPCPREAENCAVATGTVIYVERVDPDGDGDAHFVLASQQSITAPGISVIDVRAELRPDPLPRPGDAIAASGPVLPGSYDQRQIEADAVVVGGD